MCIRDSRVTIQRLLTSVSHSLTNEVITTRGSVHTGRLSISMVGKFSVRTIPTAFLLHKPQNPGLPRSCGQKEARRSIYQTHVPPEENQQAGIRSDRGNR